MYFKKKHNCEHIATSVAASMNLAPPVRVSSNKGSGLFMTYLTHPLNEGDLYLLSWIENQHEQLLFIGISLRCTQSIHLLIKMHMNGKETSKENIKGNTKRNVEGKRRKEAQKEIVEENVERLVL